MVPLRCKSLHQFLVSKEALKTAQQTESIWEYTKALFMDFFDPHVAILCTVSGTNNAAWDHENMRATLPGEVLGVLLGTFEFINVNVHPTNGNY